MRFNIPVENIEKMRKTAHKAEEKAIKYGCDILYKEIEEVFNEEKDENGRKVIRKYIVVEVEGVAKINGWIFVGTIEHTENGNILRSVYNDYKIPERYHKAEPNCEHCNTKRYRKDTYVVYNEETQEYKQVGKTCLKEYTNGIDIEIAACIMSFIEKAEEYSSFNGITSYKYYYDVREISKYFVETIRKFGWTNSSWEEESTKNRALRFYLLDIGDNNFTKEQRVFIEEQMNEVNFNPKNITDEYIEDSLNWAKNWDGHEYNDYRENLKVIANMKYCEYKHLGYLASLFMSYDKSVEREIEREKNNKEKSRSEYIGNIKDKIECEIKNFKVLTAWDTQWGTTFLYEFITKEGNVLIWKTSKWIDEEQELNTIKGTVKNHKEFRNIKQTEITRCKVM